MTAAKKSNNDPTLIEPFIFNIVSADIRKHIFKEQNEIASDQDLSMLRLDLETMHKDHALSQYLTFIDSLLSVRFNEHASVGKAANLSASREIQGYPALFDKLEREMPHLFNVEDGYIIANTQEGESYFEGQAYQDIENVVSCVRTHLQKLEEEFRECGDKKQGDVYKDLEKALRPLERYAHARAGLAFDRCPDFKPKRDVDYSPV